MTTEKIEATFWHWIGLRPISFYYRFQWLGRIAGALLWLAAMTYLVAGLWVGIELFGALVTDGAPQHGEAVRNSILVFVALIGAPFVAWRAIIASAQAKTAYEGLLTDRFTKAVEQLGAVRRTPRRERLDKEQWGQWETEEPVLEVRLGGLYALERLSADSERDHIPIMETICAYIRANSESNNDQQLTPAEGRMHGETEERVYRPRADIQAAMRILGRRSESRRAHENRSKFRLDLTGLRLRQIDLEGAKLGYAYLGSADLTDSYLGDADLSGAWLRGVNFDKAVLKQCSLVGAAVLGANFQNAKDLLKPQLESAFGVKTGFEVTRIWSGWEPPAKWFEPPRPDMTEKEFYDAYEDALKAWPGTLDRH